MDEECEEISEEKTNAAFTSMARKANQILELIAAIDADVTTIALSGWCAPGSAGPFWKCLVKLHKTRPALIELAKADFDLSS